MFRITDEKLENAQYGLNEMKESLGELTDEDIQHMSFDMKKETLEVIINIAEAANERFRDLKHLQDILEQHNITEGVDYEKQN